MAESLDTGQPPDEITVEHTRGPHFATLQASGALITSSADAHFLTFYLDVPDIVKETMRRLVDGAPGAYDAKGAKFDVVIRREEQCRVTLSSAAAEGLLQLLAERLGKELK